MVLLKLGKLRKPQRNESIIRWQEWETQSDIKIEWTHDVLFGSMTQLRIVAESLLGSKSLEHCFSSLGKLLVASRCSQSVSFLA